MTDPCYVLHYAPDNASLIIRLALEELGLPYETRLVDRRQNGQRTPAYLALNPNGLIPALETPDGAMFETAAILLWLADRHGGLAPHPDAPERADCLKWLFFMSNTLHAALRRLFYPATYVGPEPAVQDALNAATRARIVEHLTVLDRRFATPRNGLILDLYLGPMLRWLGVYPQTSEKSWFALARYPALSHAVQEFETRASVAAAAHAEGLGPKPFTQPMPPNPPEGSAL
jgi:glutathione S-transferase